MQAGAYTLGMLIPLGTDRARKRRPHATGMIIILNMAVYLIALAMDVAGQTEIQDFMHSMAVNGSALADGAYWTLLSYQFAQQPRMTSFIWPST